MEQYGKNTFNNLRLAGLIKHEENAHQHEHLIKAVLSCDGLAIYENAIA